jgi:hypothetical protein
MIGLRFRHRNMIAAGNLIDHEAGPEPSNKA